VNSVLSVRGFFRLSTICGPYLCQGRFALANRRSEPLTPVKKYAVQRPVSSLTGLPMCRCARYAIGNKDVRNRVNPHERTLPLLPMIPKAFAGHWNSRSRILPSEGTDRPPIFSPMARWFVLFPDASRSPGNAQEGPCRVQDAETPTSPLKPFAAIHQPRIPPAWHIAEDHRADCNGLIGHD